MTAKTAIVLFCDDFRIKDNPALYYASRKYDNIIPLYIYQENYLGRNLGAASKVFLHNVLIGFNNLFNCEYGIDLIIKIGNIINIINEISNKIPINAIYFNHSYTQTQIKNENDIRNHFSDLDVQSFKAKLLFDPWEIKPSSESEYYKVFTPFSKECIKKVNLILEPLPKPENIASKHSIIGDKINTLNLIPKNEGNWHAKVIECWTFDYLKIEKNFSNFISNKLDTYKEDRDYPNRHANSRISPYLRFGMLSVKSCFNSIIFLSPNVGNQFVLELLWREFSYHIMFYNKNIASEELKEKYKNFEWNNSDILLKKWQKGKTGFDIVDSGMKELWNTGTMHNRVRMIVASFLIKDLIINWKLGEQWFWNTLVDADPAINPFSWQWVFGSGFDAAPYFRIFNPESQSKKFDPDKSYCKKWLPKNWQPEKIINHDKQRKIILKKYENLQ